MSYQPTEREEQMVLIDWLRYNNIFHFAPMNENQGSFTNRKVAMIQEAKAKRMGKIKGTSDLIVMLPNKILFIELKRSAKVLKNGKQSVTHTKVSDEQKSFLKTVNGFEYAEGVVAYGAREAIEFIESRNV